MNKRAFFRWLTVAVATLSLAACGGGSSDSSTTPASIRLVNLTTATDLKLTAGTTTYNSGVTSGAASSYADIDVGTYSVIVSSAAGSLTTSTTTSMSFSSDVDYSIVAFERGGLIKLLVLTDNVDTDDISSGYAQLTVYNAGSDAGTVDVYVVASGVTDLTDLSPTFSSTAGTGTSLTQTEAAGTYDIIVTGANKPKDVRLTLTGVTLASQNVYSLVLTPTTSGTLVNGAVIKQASTVTFTSNTKARVRLVPSFGSTNVAVSAEVGGTPVSSVTSPSVGNYVLVNGNTPTYSVSVGSSNTAATVPTKTFVGGGDYTILVYGTSSASPSVSVIKDDNRLPSTANIRIVNSAVSTGGLTLVSNNISLFSEVAFGSASDYTGVTTGSNKLEIYSSDTNFGTNGYYTRTDNLLGGGVYTLFIIGPTSDSRKVLSKDR